MSVKHFPQHNELLPVSCSNGEILSQAVIPWMKGCFGILVFCALPCGNEGTWAQEPGTAPWLLPILLLPWNSWGESSQAKLLKKKLENTEKSPRRNCWSWNRNSFSKNEVSPLNLTKLLVLCSTLAWKHFKNQPTNQPDMKKSKKTPSEICLMDKYFWDYFVIAW